MPRSADTDSITDIFDGEDQAVLDSVRPVPSFRLARPLTEENQEPELSSNAKAFLDQWLTARQPEFGRAALREMQPRLERALRWTDAHYDEARGPFASLANAVVAKARAEFIADVGHQRLRREKIDEDLRDAAIAGGEEELLAYVDYLRRLYKRRRRARMWTSVRGMPADEIEHEFIAEAIEVVRRGGDSFRAWETAGQPASQGLFNRLRRRLRRQRRVHAAVPVDECEAELSALADQPLSPEEILVSLAERRENDQLLWAVRGRLSRRQREWFEAMLKDAREHDRVNFTRVAGGLGRNRSNATRAKDLLRDEIAGIREALDRLVGTKR